MQPELSIRHDIYNTRFPNFCRPKILGYIGLENLMFCKKILNTSVNYDLNLLLEKATRKPDDRDVKLNDLLHFLLDHQKLLHLPVVNNIDNARIFCYRGLMTCVACTPYENRDPWEIVVILFKGNIFLCARDTPEKIYQKTHMTEKDKKFTSWGYKFEQFMLSNNPDSEPNPNEPVDETKEFSLVFTTTINQHTIIYGAEMDGIRCDKFSVPSPPVGQDPERMVQYFHDKEFVELKTSRHIENSNQDRNFKRFKTKKWWCQSFLAGIDTILCGFRNDDGIVEELKIFPVKDIAKMSDKFWKANICMNFLDTFFSYVKRSLAREIKSKHGEKGLNNIHTLPMISFMLKWSPGMAVQVSYNYSHENDPILSQQFMENFGK